MDELNTNGNAKTWRLPGSCPTYQSLNLRLWSSERENREQLEITLVYMTPRTLRCCELISASETECRSKQPNRGVTHGTLDVQRVGEVVELQVVVIHRCQSPQTVKEPTQATETQTRGSGCTLACRTNRSGMIKVISKCTISVVSLVQRDMICQILMRVTPYSGNLACPRTPSYKTQKGIS